MNLVTLHHVGVAYDGYEALKNVDLTIAQDDFLGIIGPNGGGKTTLVKAILGTVPHTGEVVLAPELFRGKERLIGYMPQISNFDRTFPISVLEVVLSGLQGHRGFVSRYTKEDRAKALRLLETSGIGETARSPIGEVSGGQMQRALLCRAVISDPKLLILDEPANFVDNKFEKELYRTLHELNTRMAIVMVSHDIGTITSVVKRSSASTAACTVTVRTCSPRSSCAITTALFRSFPTGISRTPCWSTIRATAAATTTDPGRDSAHACLRLGRDAGKAGSASRRPNVPAADRYTVFASPGRVMNFVRKAPKK